MARRGASCARCDQHGDATSGAPCGAGLKLHVAGGHQGEVVVKVAYLDSIFSPKGFILLALGFNLTESPVARRG